MWRRCGRGAARVFREVRREEETAQRRERARQSAQAEPVPVAAPDDDQVPYGDPTLDANPVAPTASAATWVAHSCPGGFNRLWSGGGAAQARAFLCSPTLNVVRLLWSVSCLPYSRRIPMHFGRLPSALPVSTGLILGTRPSRGRCLPHPRASRLRRQWMPLARYAPRLLSWSLLGLSRPPARIPPR